MDSCSFFKVKVIQFPSREKSAQVLHAGTHRIPWCAHKHSPAPSNRTDTAGAATRLQCGGDLACCKVPKERFEDFI